MYLEQKKACFDQRARAFLVDAIVLGSVFYGVFVLLFFRTFTQLHSFEDMLQFSMRSWLVVFLIYSLKDIRGGVSLGKWAIGLGVRRAGDAATVPSFFRLFCRNVLTLAWPLELAVLRLSKSERKIGDMLAGTDVLVLSAKTNRKVVMTILAIAVGFAVASQIVLMFGFMAYA